MEERKFWNSQLEEIEGLQFRQETGTHLASLVVEEEVCVFICFIFLSRNEIWASFTAKIIRFYLEGYYLNTGGFWLRDLGQTYLR